MRSPLRPLSCLLPRPSTPAESSPSVPLPPGLSSVPRHMPPPAWPPHHPAEQAAIPDAESPSQPAGHQEQAAVHRGISFLSRRAQRALRPRSTFHLPLKTYGAHTCTWPPSMGQATTLATTGPPSQPANPQEDPTHPQRAGSQPRLVQLAARPLDPFPSVSQWLNIFPLPHSPGISQRNTFYRRIMGEAEHPRFLDQ